MTNHAESRLFDFAGSPRHPETEDEMMVIELHAALGTTQVPSRLLDARSRRPAAVWHRYLNVGVAALLLLALAGVSFNALTLKDTDTPPGSVPPVVLGLASPTTATGSAGCDISLDIPLISGMEQSPVPGTSILLTPSGELVLTCDSQREVLLTDIDLALSTPSPGLLFLQSGIDIVLYNLALREPYTFSDPGFLTTEQHARANTLRGGKRLWIVPSSDSALNASLLNLETFEEIPLTDADGQSLRIDRLGVAATNYEEDSLVLAYSQYRPDLRAEYLQGYLFVVPDRKPVFLNAGSSLPLPRELAVSPDGTHFAAVTFQGQGDSGSTHMSITRMAALNAIWRADYATPDMLTFLTWLPSGADVVFTDGSRLLSVAAPFFDEETRVVLETGQIRAITLTRDPNVVSVATFDKPQNTGPATPGTVIVNAATGETTALEGIDIFTPRLIHPSERNALLLQDTMVQDQTIEVYDAATGEHLGTIDRPVQAQGGFSSSQYGYGRGEMGVVSFGADYTWQLLGGNFQPMLRPIDPPPGITGTMPVSVKISEDGWLVLRTTEGAPGWIVNLGDEKPTWIEVDFPPGIQSPGLDVIQGME